MKPYSTNPQALTRYLNRHGFTHTVGIHPGFYTSLSDVEGRSTVHYAPGFTGADQTPEQRLTTRHTELTRMQAVLAQRYRVSLHTAREASLAWLRVEEDPDSALTPPQRTALDGIRAGGIVYRYGPLTPALEHPGDTTPTFSGGLHAGTVLALERMHRVRLVPDTPVTGRVVALDTPEEN